MAFASLARSLSHTFELHDGWALLAACFFLELLAGSPYAWPLYSADVRTTLGISQQQLENISSLGSLGLYLSMPGGFFMDRFGYPAGGIVGCGMLAAGTGFGAVVLSTMAPPAGEACSSAVYWMFTVSVMVAYQGCGWIDAVAMGSAVDIFAASRGTAVGVLKSFFGLGAGIYGQVLLTMQLGGNTAVPLSSVLCILALVLGMLACLTITMTNELRHERAVAEEEAEAARAEAGVVSTKPPGITGSRFKIAYIMVLSLAATLSVVSVIKQTTGMDSAWMGVPALLLLASLTGLGLKCGRGRPPLERLIEGGTELSDGPADPSFTPPQPLESRDWTALQALLSLDFWLFLVANFLGMGAGLMLLFNISQLTLAVVGEESDAEKADVGDLVVMASVANACGRMAAGLSSDLLSRKFIRPWFFAFWLVVLGAGCALLSSMQHALLFPGIIVALLGYGGIWACTPVMCRELFGFTHFGSIYTAISVAPAAGSTVYNSVIVTYWYQQALAEPTAKYCYGAACYQPTLFMCAGGCVVAASLAAILACRSKNLYAAAS